MLVVYPSNMDSTTCTHEEATCDTCDQIEMGGYIGDVIGGDHGIVCPDCDEHLHNCNAG